MHWALDWALGLFFSVFLGHLVCAIFLVWLRKWQLEDPAKIDLKTYLGFKTYPEVKNSDNAYKTIPVWIIGPLERLFFTFAIAFGFNSIPVAMMAWITVKMGANWLLRIPLNKREHPMAMSALVGSILSMSFALFGGLICRGYFF